MKENNVIVDKAMDFAIRIVNLYKYLQDDCHREYIISKQIFRSGTSIGANIAEAVRAESDLDFVHKLKISRKEAQETMFWLDLLFRGDYLEGNISDSMKNDCEELLKLLTSIIKSMEYKIYNKK